jgi:hypothetical protein
VEGCRGPPMTAGIWNRLHGALDTAGDGRSSAAGGFSTVEHASTRLQVGCERGDIASKRQVRPAVSGVRFVSVAWGGHCWLLVIVLSRQCSALRHEHVSWRIQQRRNLSLGNAFVGNFKSGILWTPGAGLLGHSKHRLPLQPALHRNHFLTRPITRLL